MQLNSVRYILGFCTAVCLACAIVVSTSAVGLKERQELNKQLDRQKKVLIVAGLLKEGQPLPALQVRELFQKRIKAVVVDLKSGAIHAKATEDAALFDQQKATAEPKTSRKAPKNRAGIARLPNQGLVFLVSKKDMDAKGGNFVLDQYIFPIEGKGLWSTLYGYISLASDFNQVNGLTFYQHGETPGLGGEVDNPSWKAKWKNRLVFGKKGSSPLGWKAPKIEVLKGLAGNPTEDPHRVDGLSGATITSKGVSELLRFWLSEEGFGPFIHRRLKEGQTPAPSEVKPPLRPAPALHSSPPAPLRPNPPTPLAPKTPVAPAPLRPAPLPPAPLRPAPTSAPTKAATRVPAPTPAPPSAPTSVPSKGAMR